MTAALRIHGDDDVAVVLDEVAAGTTVAVIDGPAVTARGPLPRGHKLALRDLPAGAPVHKYGAVIGVARRPIRAGDPVHTDNLATRLAGPGDYAYAPPTSASAPASVPDVAPWRFDGYRRADGRVGTRNEVWVLATVGCVARLAQRLAEAGRTRAAGRVEGVHALTHPFGCSQSGHDLDDTRRVLAALASHPNAGGVLVVGLGCETNQARALLDGIARADDRVRVLTAQADGDEFERGLVLLDELIAAAAADRREPCGPEHLVLGLKCGGSDGLSGVTANPLVGRVAERIVGRGGRALLTEIPEAFGAEQVLLERAVSREVFERAAAVFRDFRAYLSGHGEPLHENPSPGNLAGGITTLEEKSLGAVQKAGRAPLAAVLRYGERIERAGLALLEAPGNDAVSSTALAAAGANVLLFTTGRGTPLGFPVPTLKIASNSELARRKPGWIDFDAGVVLAPGGAATAEAALLELVRTTASGAPARNELNDEREIALWKRGVTL